MAKVTITITDNEAGNGVSCAADFDQPGKSYEEMTANPTIAVSLGLMLLSVATDGMKSVLDYSGTLRDEFGYERNVSNANPL